MQPNCLVSLLLLIGLLQVSSSARVTRSLSAVQQQSTSFECGKPYGPCGSGIPVDVSCEAGPGWCTPGYHCAAENGTAPSRCLPVQANCGVAGGECSVVLLAADLPAEVQPSVLAWQKCFAQLELHHTAIQLPAQRLQ